MSDEYERVVRYCLYSNFDKLYKEYTSPYDLHHVINTLVKLMTSNWFACNINAFMFFKHVIMNGYYDGNNIINKYLESSLIPSYRRNTIENVIKRRGSDNLSEEALTFYINNLYMMNGEMTNQYEVAEEDITENNRIHFVRIILSFIRLREEYVNKSFLILKKEFGDIAHIIKLYI